MTITARLVCFSCWALLTLRSAAVSAQERSTAPANPPTLERHEPNRVGLGAEADILPYVLHGAHGDVWAGYAGWRARAIAASSRAPSFFTPSGFENLRTTILELEADRFFGVRAAEFRGPWVALGGGLSLLSIDAKSDHAHGSTSAFEVSGGVGFTFCLPLGFYLDPWLGFTYEFTPSSVEVGTQRWKPARFGPVLGLKIGWNALL